MLTDRTIQAEIRKLKEGEKVLNDGAAGRGTGSLRLRLRVNAAGVSATWLAFWKRDGQRATKPLGKYPEMSLADARMKFAAEVRESLVAGKNPKVAQPVGVEKPTVEAMFQAYIEHLRAKGARSVAEIERTLLTGKYNCADGLGRGSLVGNIEPADVSAFLATRFAQGVRRQTDISRTFMRAAFNWAMQSAFDYRTTIRRDWGLKSNPVAAVPRDMGANRVRDRNLSAEEIRAVWFAAPDLTGDVLRLVIACGQRVLETIKVEGRDIDLEKRVWNMPAEKTKMGKRPHIVPLPRQAVEIFAKLKARHGDGYLFPGRRGAKGSHFTIPSVSRGASRLTCCAPFQPRDLRRTWKSRAGDGARISKETRDLIQQHAKIDTSGRVYDWADYLPQMREGMDKWEAWLDQVLAGQLQEAKAA